MKITQTVAEILDQHVTLEVECIDRMYLNVYVPQLQHVNGVVGFFRGHRKQVIASSALMGPISKKFIEAIESLVEENKLLRSRSRLRSVLLEVLQLLSL